MLTVLSLEFINFLIIEDDQLESKPILLFLAYFILAFWNNNLIIDIFHMKSFVKIFKAFLRIKAILILESKNELNWAINKLYNKHNKSYVFLLKIWRTKGHSSQVFHSWPTYWDKPKMYFHLMWSLYSLPFSRYCNWKLTIFLFLQCCHFVSIVTEDSLLESWHTFIETKLFLQF